MILGGSGLVGSSIIELAKNDFDVFFSYNKNKILIPKTQSFQIDLLNDQDNIEQIIYDFHPKTVLQQRFSPDRLQGRPAKQDRDRSWCLAILSGFAVVQKIRLPSDPVARGRE